MDDKRKLLLSLLARASAPAPASDGVAIVGVAGRYPLAGTPAELWDNLAAGRSGIREVPADRWDADAHHDPAGVRGSYSKWAGFIDDVDKFDPLFFQISPADAEAMDPQERLFLQTAAAVLDDAGHPAADLAARGPVGVFAGVMNNNYEWMGGEATALGVRTDAHSNHWSIANRVSYTFDFTGPSLAVDTACSASLTAIHLACESIRSGECHSAIAGGVNLILHPMHLRMLADRGMISRGDRLKSFGADADGFVDGEGVGAVLLRPLKDAVADGDRVLGVIRGSAINAGGKTGGYTVPSAAAQAEVIRAALHRAQADPGTVGYVEAHGTGTPLGDPIEIAGLVEAFGGRVDAAERAGRPTVAVGSVKSNIGHLESAAGVAGLTKVLFQLRHRTLVPSLNSARRNPGIDFSTTPFEVQQTLRPWEPAGDDGDLPLRAVVSSFGGGGANACLVVDEYRTPPAEPVAPDDQILVLSAKSEDRLRAYATDLAAFLRGTTGAEPADAGRDALGDAQRLCLRLAAESVGVAAEYLDLGTDLADCGFGVPERARLEAALAAALDGTLPAAVPTARTLGAMAQAVAGTVAGNEGVAGSVGDAVAGIAGVGGPAGDAVAGMEGDHGPAGDPVAGPEGAGGSAGNAVAGTEGAGESAGNASRATDATGAAGALAGAGVRGATRPAEGSPRLADVAHTLQSGRTPHEFRLALAVGSVAEAATLLEAYAEGTADARIATGRATRARVVLTGTEADALEAALARRDLAAVAGHWLAGADVDWSRVTPAAARRTELPTYPFARKRYWIPEPPARTAPARPAGPDDASAEQLPDFYRPLWVREDTPAPGSAPRPGRVVALVTEASARLAEAISARITDSRPEQVRIDELPPSAWLERTDGADLVLHLGGVGTGIAEGLGADRAAEQLRTGTLSLFHLVRSTSAARVVVVTSDVHPVAGGTVANPFAAGMHGLLQVVAKERPELRVAGLDVASADLTDEDAIAALADAILAAPTDATGRTVALRGGARYVRRLGRVTLPAPGPVFRDGGVYLLVGGTGGIAQELSRHLAERHRARLVWFSRGDLGPEQRAAAEEIRALGGDVAHVRGDACATADLAAAVAEAHRRFGALHGVVHAAMVFDNHALADLDEETFTAATRVKTEGAAALAAAVDGRHLDFLVYFSSAGSFGSFAGNGAYICASATEDAYALFLRDRLPYPVTVVNQGYWGLVGSGARPGLADIFAGLGITGFSPATGIAAVHRILGSGLPQVMPIRAGRRALEAMGHDPALDGEVLGDGHPAALAAAAGHLGTGTAAGPAARRVLTGYEELEAVSAPMLLGVYQRMGAFRRSGERHGAEELRGRLGILDRFRRLHEALLNILADAGFLTRDGDLVATAPAVDGVDADAHSGRWEAEFDRIAAAYPDIEPTVTLNRLFLQAYPRILRGEVGATEIMFPGSSMKLVQNFYKGNPLTDSFNLLVHDTVRHFLDLRLPRLPRGRTVEVVELGAGTGATSERVLPALAAHPGRVGYTFTDISPRFLEHGRERFAARYDFARFQVLNLERGLAEQGFEPACADLVVATNVVHATSDLRATLRKAKALLRPGGWLVLNELTSVRPLLTIGGGVLEGWWAFEDGHLRMPDSPLASPQGWARLLHEEGYAPVHALGAGDPALGQTVLVAESDGVLLTAPAPTAGPTTATASATASTPVSAPASVPSGAATSTDVLTERLRDLVERVLKLDERIDPGRPLADYGFDSLSGMKIVAAVDEEFGVAVPLGDFFEQPTLRELTAHLAANRLAGAAAGLALPEAPGTPVLAPTAPGPTSTGPVPAPTGPVPADPPAVSPATEAAARVLRPRTDGEESRHPLSEGQRALWVIEQIAPGTYAYNLPLALWLDRGLDVLALRAVLQDLVDRHAELRATVHAGDGEPYARIATEPELPFQQVFLTARSDAELRDRMRADLRRPFELAAGPLVRATLYTLGDGRNALLLTFHHLVFDGVSIALLLRELESGYRALLEGRALSTERPARGYADFTAWQRELLDGAEGRRLRAYWTERLRGRRTTVPLPLDRPRPAVPGFRGASLDGHIPAEVADRARALAGAEQTTLFGVVLAAWFTLLHRYGDQADIAVGTPTAGRPASGFDDTFGYFMNMVVLAEHIDGAEEFRGLVRRVHRTVLDALEHSAYPLITLADDLRRADPEAGAPFNVAFYFQNWTRTARRDASGDTVVLGPVEGVHQEGEFDLTLEVVEQERGCRYTLKYDPDLFDEQTVARLGAHFATLLAAAVETPGTPVADLELLTEDERARIAPPAPVDYPADTLVWELVRRQADARPDAVAVRHAGTELTYRALVRRVDALAARLTAAGAGRGRTVGVLLPRDQDLPVALLAVQASGAAYVPLDPAYPQDRLAYMAEDAGLHLLLTHSASGVALAAVPRLVVDSSEQPPALPSPGPAGPSDAAYVIYTSGSTGRPKGVRVPHRALTNFLWSMAREPGFGPGDTLLALTTVCFDISGLELYLPLVAGGTVEVLAAEDARDGLRLREALERARPTVVQATPATWSMLLAAGWQGDPALKVLCGGEALPADLAEALLAGNGQVWNLYGPTETTIWSAASRLAPGGRVTLGAPIANTALHVLDSAGRPVPTAVAGELYIGGDGVADGYLGRPDLTSRRFLPDPFAARAEARMYRTGDLVRRLADGTIEYLGRLDSQVKVRGYRVELEEIEATLRRLDGVREAVVVARGQAAGSHTLLACYVLEDGAAEPDRERLAAWLPDHMVPDALVRVTGFPRTLNGKTDRTALAELPLADLRARFGAGSPPAARSGAPAGAADGRTEALVTELAGMVAALVDARPEDIGAHTPLGEAGMNSVGFTALSAELRKAYGITEYPTLFYRRGTLHALAEHLWEQHATTLAAHFGAAPRTPATEQAATAELSTAPTGSGTSGAPAGTGTPVASDDREVAVIGMAGRLPGSMDLGEFWDHLAAGDDLVGEIPADRWDWREHPRSRSRWGGFAPDVDRFDAAFFGISPREAELMDPQQRLLLETVWQAVEDAGYRPSELAGKRVGVFIAVTNSDYHEVQRAAGRATEGHTLTGAALSIVPNRVSYLLDLRGPSIAVDTACSGSLTAVHQACAALRDGTCDLAIAGGVSLILAPGVYEALSQGEMLSPDGRCKAFDSRADGYVRGEGAGVVLLKPHERAERDGDAVHAVIKAVALNHGGRTTSLTAPDPDAQADLLVEAYRAAGVHPDTVGYIEAHGTGTALGDPIETTGLSTAFRRLRAGKDAPGGAAPCAIGSVKTNIGHLEAAAGIAGLFKAVLSMRHGTIPASLHFREQNPYLELDGGPFEVAGTARPWPRPRDAHGTELPRRGGVSSFGFGGAGAHIVLEEPHMPDNRDEPAGQQVFVLSARDGDALRRSAARLADHLGRRDVPAADLAHTLQTGREPMPHRLAVVADGTAALRAELTAHLAGRPSAVRTAQVSAPPAGDPVSPDPHDLDALAAAWLHGADVDWRTLHEGTVRRRVHLPAYPFAGTRHWVAPGERPAEPGPRLHPTLLDANVSTFGEQRFTKTLTGEEFFLRDHVVGGELVLPGVAYLEMGRLSGELAAGGAPVRGVDDLVWAAPVRLASGHTGHPLLVRVTGDRSRAAFEVRGTAEDAPVHAGGTLRFDDPGPRPAPVDPADVRARCTRVEAGTDCYDGFVRLGFAYGPAFRVIEEIAQGPGEALATLRLPEPQRADAGAYAFHPSLLDAALQTAGRLVPGAGDPAGPAPYLPFSLGSVRLHAPLPERGYAYATLARRPAPAGSLAFDVALLDENGQVAATLESFTLRAVRATDAARAADTASTHGTRTVPAADVVHAFEPVWTAAPAAHGQLPAAARVLLLDPASADATDVAGALTAAGADVHRVPLGSGSGGTGFDAEAAVRAAGAGPVHVVHLAGGDRTARDSVEHGFHAALAFLRAWQRERRDALRYLYVHPEPAPSPAQPAMAAFARTVRLEQPSVALGVLAVAPGRRLGEAVVAELGTDGGPRVREDATGRARPAWRAVSLPTAPGTAFTGAGAHLVTGGTGALGLLVAEHIAAARRAAGVTGGGIVLAARTAPGPGTRARVDALGARVVLADVTDPAAVHDLVAEARRAHGSVSGVVHAAGVLRDGLIRTKQRADADAVLAAKVHGTVLLDEATADEPLDYFVTFSSAAAAFGNAGQSDYAFANAFLDHFAEERERRRREGARHGRTLAAAWPLWAEGGMRVDADAEAYMERALGMRPLRTAPALRALDRALAHTAPRLLLAAGDPDRILRALEGAEPHRDESAAGSAAEPGLHERAEELVLRLLAEELKLPEAEIAVAEPFDRFGVDSLITMSLIRRLEEHVGPLSKTLLFEYVTVRDLAGHLAGAHPGAFPATAPGTAAATTPAPETATPAATVLPTRPAEQVAPAAPAAPAQQDDVIAIIGVAGRYPQADDVTEYWRNLRAGRDSVEEIPADRWDHGLFHDPDKSATGKTYGKWGGFVPGADRFDPLFFRMSQIEAEHTDPQERVFLETVWHLMEDAGYTREQLSGARTGVFVGMMYGHYQLYGVQEALRGEGFATSSSYASVANRVSYFFDFTGPSVGLDTMCSSSLVTIHQACLAIRNGDCDVAVAGGVNISSHPVKFLQLAQRGFLAEDGRCRSFGEGGTGYVPAEGSGAVLLKRLDAALADGDRILAVVKASAVNHGGAGAGYSVPNPKAQGELVRTALERAGLAPADLDYLEAHGTGTALGDPVEITGMLRAFGEEPPERLPIGSVKSNIGHAESAAGIAAITKVLLQMRHGELVPSLHADRLNPNIDFTAIPFEVQRERAPWPRRVLADGGVRPRTAGVSSFGAGGTNAHIILQEYVGDGAVAAAAPAGPQLAVLSARDTGRLTAQARRLADHLRTGEDTVATPAQVAWTLQTGREAMAHRLAVLFHDLPELCARLDEFAAGGAPAGSWTGVVDPRRPVAGEPLPADPAAYGTAWTGGQQVDWPALHPGGRPARVALPGYPFDGDRVWLAAADAELTALGAGRDARGAGRDAHGAGRDAHGADVDAHGGGRGGHGADLDAHRGGRSAQGADHGAPDASHGARGDRRDPEGLLLTRQWRPAPPGPRSAPPALTAVLAAPGTEALAARLAAVLPAAEVLTADRIDAELTDPGARWDRFDAVVDLAGCTGPVLPPPHTALPSWLRWLQHLVDLGRRDLRALLVSRGVPALGGAARVGLYRMLQSEYRHVRSRHVEIDGAATDEQLCRWVTEELSADGEPAEVAYRGGVRHLATLAEPPRAQRAGLGFPADHVLWVTGGTRGLGLLTARHFVARHGVRKLVLTGREELPPRAEWAAHIAEDGPLGRKLRPLAELAAQGVELEAVAVPLDEKEALAKVLADVRLRLSPVGGVIHSAGFTDFENPAFVRKQQTGVARVLAPKVFGLDALLECFRDEPLGLFVLYSSVAAAVPALAVGQSDYAMANAYLDAVAEARPYGLPLLSVQWPSWKDTGMGEARSAAYQASGLASLTDAQGLALLDRALESGARVVMPVLPRPGAEFSAERLTARRLEAPPAAPAPAPAAAAPAPRPAVGAGADVRAAVEAVASWLLDQLAAELRFDRAKLAGDVPVHDYGMDSIMVSQLVQTVAQRLGVSVDPSALLEHPTVDGFAAYLGEEHRTELLAEFGGTETGATAPEAQTGAEVPPVTATPAPVWAFDAPSAPPATAPRQAPVSHAPGSAPRADAVAVVGLSCRFPDADSADAYWELLRDGRSALRPLPDSRFGRSLGYHAGLLPEVLRFAPERFLLSEADVKAMDPQALLLLEEVDRAVHHAGYHPADLKGRRVGVYVGGRATHTPDPAALELAKNPVVVTGQNYLAANISQFFDFQGPSLVVDTACSSALVAMDMAVQALRAGTVESAVVAGVSLLADDRAHQVFGQRGLLNPGPEFHAFDGRAAGLVLGEGVGVVVLKPLARAQADGDRVLAVLEGIAVNNDGRTAGPATPNLRAQKDVMAEALALSGRAPRDVGWVEANASGSTVTDLLELKAIEGVYGAGPDRSTPLALGSVKPNIGHPLAAEGIAAFIKVALMLHHRQQVPFRSGQHPLPHFDLDASAMYFPREPRPWTAGADRAALNCFADGGTNAHLLLAPAPADHHPARAPLPRPSSERTVVIRGTASDGPDAPAPSAAADLFWDTYR
ncbi:amino acid adenylation domain-containing protein [Streptomyces sp. NPDC096094]|uniref:amino acid adenylation domain-containing protein n=1 Tax=Streptomyces sp. NPDC096094 TaxID=3366073 RepID=UPI00380F7618